MKSLSRNKILFKLLPERRCISKGHVLSLHTNTLVLPMASKKDLQSVKKPKTITDDCIEEYQQNGVVCLRGFFSQYWIDKVRKGIKKVLLEPSQYSDTIISNNGKGIYFNDYYQWRRIKEFSEYVRKSPAANISASFLATKEVTFYHEHVFFKESFNESETPWHQDQSYYPVDGWQVCSLWMPVTSVEASSSLKFIKGSHKWGKWFIPRKFQTLVNYNIENEFTGQEYETMPVIKEKDYDVLSWDMEPGDCLVFHMRSVHGISPSSSSKDRQILATRWLGDDAIFAKRPWITSPPVLPSDIEYGNPMKSSKEYEVLSKSSY